MDENTKNLVELVKEKINKEYTTIPTYFYLGQIPKTELGPKNDLERESAKMMGQRIEDFSRYAIENGYHIMFPSDIKSNEPADLNVLNVGLNLILDGKYDMAAETFMDMALNNSKIIELNQEFVDKAYQMAILIHPRGGGHYRKQVEQISLVDMALK